MLKYALFFLVSLLYSSGAFAETISLGTVHSLTGWGAVAGVSERRAIEMAVEDINGQGGIAGKQVKILAEDNQSSFKETVSAFHRLAAFKKVPVVLGPNWSEFSEAVAPIADERKTPLITASGYSETLAANHPFVFTLLPDYAVVVRPLVEKVVRGEYSRIALLVSENAYFEGLAEAITEELRKKNVSIWQEVRLRPELNDYRSTISHFKRSKVEAVIFLLTENGDNAAFLRQAKEQEFSADLFSSNAVVQDVLVPKMPKAAAGVVFFNFSLQATEDFIVRYKKKFHEPPYFSAPKAYDSVFLVKQAIESCGEKPADIRRCLLQSDYEGVSGRIRFHKDGSIQNGSEVTSLFRYNANGEIEPLSE